MGRGVGPNSEEGRDAVVVCGIEGYYCGSGKDLRIFIQTVYSTIHICIVYSMRMFYDMTDDYAYFSMQYT